MTGLFIDGFDKYGPPSVVNANVTDNLSREWNVIGVGTTVNIVPGLSANSYALEVTTGGAQNTAQLGKTLPVVGRIIGGYRFTSPIAVARNNITSFTDGGTSQVTIEINATGNLVVRSGLIGTILGTSSAAILSGVTYYLEWDITIGATAAYQLWLNGTSILTGSGNTRGGTANNQVNSLTFYNSVVNWVGTFDDLYLFDAAGSRNNAVLNTNPRVETHFASNDSAVTFDFGAAILGSAYSATTGTNAPGANQLFLRRFMPTVTCTINSVACVPAATSAAAKFRGVIYSDSAGVASTLLSSGTEVTGATVNIPVIGPLVTPQALTIGTPYWIGFITDTSVILHEVDTTITGSRAANTYASGAPGTAPAMTTGQPSWITYGNLSGISVNYYEVAINPPPGDISYVFSATVGDEDLYNFPALITTPANIYTVAVKGFVKNFTSGARTITFQTKSGATDTSSAALAPDTSYQWLGAFFDVDPNTAATWTPTGLNNATSGVKIVS